MWKKTTFWSALMVCPLNSVSVVDCRRKFITGVTNRSISSTADGSSDRSLRNSSHWSGWSKKATMAPEIRFRVVSFPATVRSRKNNSNSRSERCSPSISTPVSTLIRSWWGSIFFLAKSWEA